MDSPIRLLVADDQPLMREAFTMFFNAEPGFEVVGAAANGREVLHRVRAVRPDVVVMDLQMPVMDGIEATQQLRQMPESPKVLVLTTFSTERWVVAAIRAGADGFLVKDARAEEVLSAVREVCRDEQPISPVAVQALTRATRATARGNDNVPAFTARELEIIQRIAQGMSNQQIADRLHLSLSTVKGYVFSATQRAGASSRVQLLLHALNRGLVTLDSSDADGASAPFDDEY